MDIRLWLAAACVASGASLLACGDGNTASQESSTSEAPAASEGNEDPAPVMRLTDAQIVAITSAANQGEVAQATAALQKLTNPEAKKFAEMMVEMHTAAQERGDALAREKGLTPKTNQFSTQLTEDSDAIIERINGANRDEVDRVYMETQVEVHDKVLKTIDEKLIPSATDPALQQELQTARGEVSMHLDRAREVVGKLE